MDRGELASIMMQLQTYDDEVKRGIVHTHSYDIKMQQYRQAVNEKYPHG